MSERDGFLRAICADPDDDTVRLAFADWLDENATSEDDRARAEFIRAQIAATRLGPGDPSGAPVRGRVVELAERYGNQWCAERKVVFVRGFPMGFWFDDLNKAYEQAEDLFSRHPIRVLYANEYWRHHETEAEVLSCPHFARLTGLGSRSRGWDGDRVAAALTNPYLVNLRMLDFTNGSYNNVEGARGIAAATHLTNLTVLDLSGNAILDDGLGALAGAKHLASLRAFRLGRGASDWSSEITADGVGALARSKFFPSLTQLVLDGNELGETGLDRLLRAEWAHQLTELDLSETGLGGGGLIALARSPRLANLRRLDVSGNGVYEAAAREFLRPGAFPNLIDLHLASRHTLDEPLTEETQAALRERFGPNVLADTRHAPTPLCVEDKIRWRMQTLGYWPPEPTEDCEAV